MDLQTQEHDKGIGKLLLQTAIDKAKHLGYKKMILKTKKQIVMWECFWKCKYENELRMQLLLETYLPYHRKYLLEILCPKAKSDFLRGD